VKSNLLILQVSILLGYNRSSNKAFAIAHVSTKGLFSSALIFSENNKKKINMEAVAVHIVSKKLVKRLGYEENPTNTYTQF